MVTSYKKKTKTELQPIYDRDARVGLSYLWKLSHQALTIHPSLTGYYMNLFQRLSILSETKIGNSVKRKYCQCCGVLFIPGITCLVKIKGNGSTPSKCLKSKGKSIEDKPTHLEPSIPSENTNQVFSSQIQPRVYTIFDSTKGKGKNQKIKSSIKFRQTLSKLIIYTCTNCNSKTCISEKILRTGNIKKDKNMLLDSKTTPLNTASQTGKISKDVPKDNISSTKSQSKEKKVKKPKTSQINLVKSTFKPASVVSKALKKGKMNLSKLLENDKKAKAEEKNSQSFSLGDFLKRLND